jgi:hypothetical protein
MNTYESRCGVAKRYRKKARIGDVSLHLIFR